MAPDTASTCRVRSRLAAPCPIHPFYADGNSGMGGFPRNAQGMARDAVNAARAQGIDFSPYDSLGERLVTALFIIHAGQRRRRERRARRPVEPRRLVPGGVDVGGGLRVSTFLTVPEDCNMGVCAHEWGHLAARWADFTTPAGSSGRSPTASATTA